MTGCLCESLETVLPLSWKVLFHLISLTLQIHLQKDSRTGIIRFTTSTGSKDSCVSWENMFSRVKMFTVWSADWPIHPLMITSHEMRHEHTLEWKFRQSNHVTILGQLTFFFFGSKSFSRKGRVCRIDSGSGSLICTVPGHTEFDETVEAMSSVRSCPISDRTWWKYFPPWLARSSALKYILESWQWLSKNKLIEHTV